jgi:hypothetical protein
MSNKKWKPEGATLVLLTSLQTQGKNAGILLVIAKAMTNDKPLPEWATAVGGNVFFKKALAKDEASLRKACMSDSYADLRSVTNAFLEKRLTAKHKEVAAGLLKINAFAGVALLKKITTASIDAVVEKDAIEHVLSLFSKMRVEQVREAYSLWTAANTISNAPDEESIEAAKRLLNEQKHAASVKLAELQTGLRAG